MTNVQNILKINQYDYFIWYWYIKYKFLNVLIYIAE